MINNIRGLTSKETMLNRIIEEEGPTIMALVETNLEEQEHISIPGYEVTRVDRKSLGGGVLLAHKKCLKNIVVCTSEYMHAHALAGFLRNLQDMADPSITELMQKWVIYYRPRPIDGE